MKGQILLTPQSTRSNLCLLCALFIAMTTSIEHRALAAESTNSQRRNPIVIPTESADENPLVINPSTTNRVRQDGIVIGSTNISDPHQMLQLYADIRGRTVRWSTNLSLPNLSFTADKPLTRDETTLALDASFGLNGIALIDIAEKWVHAVRSESCQTSSNPIYQTVAHLQHLTYLKPSELVPILQPFTSSDIANGLLPLNAQQALMLRDRPENVQRMLQVIQRVDVEPPPEYISEVIPFKYAKASEIVAAIHGFATNRFGKPSSPFGTRSSLASPPWLLERLEQRVRSLGGPSSFPRVKMLADERTNSLLVYAGREDMKRIKELVSNLDLVSAQILVEAVIIEVNRTNGFAIQGIDDHEFPWMTNFIPIAVTNTPAVSDPTRATRANLKAGFYRFAAISNDVESFVTTLASNSSVKILQRPRIQTPNGEPLQLFVGESRPYPSGPYTTCGSEYTSMPAINQGVTLEVTPSITNDGMVVLDIHQTIEKANGTVTIENVGEVPISSRTERSAKVLVNARSVLVLDGCLERTNATPRPGTFKRIVTLNGLFHHSKSVTNQNELIVLLRPTILPASEAAAQLSKAEKDKMPGVKRAELEIQFEEANRLKQLEKTLKDDRHLGRN
jgi:type II secretory pathway component GspD/PulD (secretin)